ncbi:MAG: type III PLP-dependent enzyme [Candidatus Atribacteria bacterium]|nr:type III PLP-dependent enzyme [Candidatus Atribacteria bacterium]
MERRSKTLERVFPLSEEAIVELANEYGTPLFLVVGERVMRNYAAFQEFFPGIEIFYAVKANPHPLVVKTLANLGSSFDVASAQEIALVLEQGVAPQRMIFANTIKRREALRYAREKGVSLLTYDNEEELRKIRTVYPEAKLILRLKTPSLGSRIDLSYKFGADPEEAAMLLKLAKNLGLETVGLSFHVGSPCHNPENYLRSLEIVRTIIQEGDREGVKLTVVDIGGGFPLHTYYTEGAEASMEYMSERIYPLLRSFLAAGYRVIAEPGRSLIGNACLLVTKVIGKAVRSGRIWYYLDDGLYGTFSAIPFDKASFDFYPLRDSEEEKPCVLAGPTCDSLDVIAEGVKLPPLMLDDLVVVPNIGAYSIASATNFNGFERARVVLV